MNYKTGIAVLVLAISWFCMTTTDAQPRRDVYTCPLCVKPVCAIRNVYGKKFIFKSFPSLCFLKQYNCQNPTKEYIAITDPGTDCADAGFVDNSCDEETTTTEEPTTTTEEPTTTTEEPTTTTEEPTTTTEEPTTTTEEPTTTTEEPTTTTEEPTTTTEEPTTTTEEPTTTTEEPTTTTTKKPCYKRPKYCHCPYSRCRCRSNMSISSEESDEGSGSDEGIDSEGY